MLAMLETTIAHYKVTAKLGQGAHERGVSRDGQATG